MREKKVLPTSLGNHSLGCGIGFVHFGGFPQDLTTMYHHSRSGERDGELARGTCQIAADGAKNDASSCEIVHENYGMHTSSGPAPNQFKQILVDGFLPHQH